LTSTIQSQLAPLGPLAGELSAGNEDNSMKKSRILVSSLAAVSVLGLSACVTDPNTGERHVSRTAIGGIGGAGLGYLLGGLIGGKTARIVGAGIGGVAGGVIGYQLDQQIKELDEATEGSGVDVTETPAGTGILVNLPDITFAVDSTTISPGLRAALDEVAQSLQKYPNSLIDVMGHTDSTGSDTYTLDLSRRRADAVKAYLVMRGVSGARIATVGYGEQYPKASNDTAEGRALNRRVEIRITPISQEEVNAAR
jgi:outer membrane protein OmpA-like peptidoglycan-associated protein